MTERTATRASTMAQCILTTTAAQFRKAHTVVQGSTTPAISAVDLFTDTAKLEREKALQETMLGIKKKFGKNAVLKGTNYLDGATMRERNVQISGHKAK